MSLSDKRTLLKRWIGIAIGKNRVAVRQDVGRCYKLGAVAGYYNDLTEKVNKNTLLDEAGIPINEIEGGQRVYFPISIFQYALGLWDLFLTSGEETYRNHFLILSEWAVDHQRADGSWDCFGPVGYKTQSVSAMGQGEGISVLVRAYSLTGNNKWIDSAKRAAQFIRKDVGEGGTLRREGKSIYLEEYPGNNGEKLSVLNGWVFATFGIYDYLLIEKEDESVRTLFEQTVRTMSKELCRYDNGYWSFYDRTGRLASPFYHQLHIALMKVMHEITGIDEFSYYAEKWTKYEKSIFCKSRAVAKKIMQKLHEKQEGLIVR